MGCGKEETITWLKRVCANRSLPVIALKPSVEDRAGEYSTVARLFRLLIREENFDDPVRQVNNATKLISPTKPTYPTKSTPPVIPTSPSKPTYPTKSTPPRLNPPLRLYLPLRLKPLI